MPPRPKQAKPKFDATMRICVFSGTEDALKRQYLRELQTAIEKVAGEVELLTYDGSVAELSDVLDELRSYGLMQQHKIVIVDAADEFLTRYREAIERYAASPVETATLVFRSNRWNPGNLDKLINKVGCIVKCADLTAAEAANWLVARARDEHQCRLDRKTADLLVRRMGADLLALDSELAKLALAVEPGQPITAELVDQLVGRASEEAAYVIQDALLEAIAATADQRQEAAMNVLTKVNELLNISRQPKELVAYFVADTFRKLYVGLLMKRQGESVSQISSRHKLWGNRQHAFFAVLDRLDDRTLHKLLDEAVAVCYRSRTSVGDAVRHIECFCALLSDLPQRASTELAGGTPSRQRGRW